ncbi:MAG: LuxR C-terminal-related transcriptional regulator [Bacteroidales bacterium]|nr:LuxR C-terminal-related transcriptional regulator [Bacteroidales bacterium]
MRTDIKIEFAIVDANTLSGMGLKQILAGLIPMVEISVFRSHEDFVMSNPERFVHCFVASGIFFEHAQYFINQPHKYIVMVQGNAYPHIAGLLTLNICQEEKDMVKSLLQLRNRGMAKVQKMQEEMPPHGMPAGHCPHSHPAPPQPKNILSNRETEVAVLLAKGLINKEIADKLNISLTTVISHRKNIMEKLNAKSLADIIIYVVMNGIVGVEEL